MVAGLLAASATAAWAASAIDSMVEVETATDDMGSTATEFSGATYNANRDVIVVIDDEINAYEFTLDGNGAINHAVPVRILTIALPGVSDYEGIAWISGERYAILSEGTGQAYIVDIPTEENTIDGADVVSTHDAGGPDGNTGSEGIALGPDGSWFVTDEKPSSLSKYDSNWNFVGEVALPELSDASGVVVAEDDTYVVISDESAMAIHYAIDWDAGTRTQLASISLSSFPQVEGIAAIGNEELHIFGEEKGGQTYSRRVGEIVESPSFEPMDVNCSGTSDVVDALLITQIEVGTTQPDPACGSGDSNDDGFVNVIDALMITQCEVGIPNVACPEG